MRIKLIAPETDWNSSISSAATFKIQRPNLPILAAVTPAEHDVQIVDEAFAPDTSNGPVDLVGITVMTELARRAYRIADQYRARGVPVVLGGIHSTVAPQESLRHADAVVVGEGERVWPRVVSDARAGRLQKIYRSAERTDLASVPLPRRELYPPPPSRAYVPFAVGLEGSRGCPFECEFCTVNQIAGRELRLRPVAEIVKEIESISSPHLFFVDDNLGLNKPAARQLFERMVPLRRNWIGQGGVTLAEDPQLLRVMRASGCRGLLIGFESVDRHSQGHLRKVQSRKVDYAEAVHRFHEEGIMVLGAFVFGFDHETAVVFDQTLEFAMRCRLDGAQLRALTPFPGTRLYERLAIEKRLIDPAWWLNEDYSPESLLFRPKGMTLEQMVEGLARVSREFYALRGIASRFFGIRPWRRTLLDWELYTGFNLANRTRYRAAINAAQPLAASAGPAASSLPLTIPPAARPNQPTPNTPHEHASL